MSFKFRVVLRRIRLFPTLISKMKWLWSELPLNFWCKNILRQTNFTAYFTMTHKWWIITFILILSKMIYFSETCGADVVVGIDMQNFNEGTWSLRIATQQIIPQYNHHVILLYHLAVGSFSRILSVWNVWLWRYKWFSYFALVIIGHFDFDDECWGQKVLVTTVRWWRPI